jgi:urea carboxylase
VFRKVLIANRGVVACRIIRTLRRMGVQSVAVYSDADHHAMHVAAADEAHCIGPAPAAQSYLSIARIVEAARLSGADAVHPGYGFLAENADFAQACEDSGIVFIGPTPGQIAAFGLKHRAREIARDVDVASAPGSGVVTDLGSAQREAAAIGYPVMLKSTAGGGGIGMLRCDTQAELDVAFGRVGDLAARSFGDGGLFLERYVARGRHVEVQIFGDGTGKIAILGDRDCSAQRRNQKIIEETPAPDLPPDIRAALHGAARRLGEAVRYRSAGTVEFIYDVDQAVAYFLEVNTRLQVEHGVTEAVLGIDIVEWMLRIAAGESMPALPPSPGPVHAIQARIYAEDPASDFRPSIGQLIQVRFPQTARIDACVASGSEVTPFYDPLLATLIVAADDRDAALRALPAALAATTLDGMETNLAYLRHLLATGVLDGEITTATLAAAPYRRERIVVVAPGTETTIQEFPGRLGFWHVGVPPSGPMDDLSFRLANRAVGNDAGAAGLEIVVSGPTLRFETGTVICLAGAELPALLDGVAVPYWTPVSVHRGATLAIGSGAPAGSRTYLAIGGGLDVPSYLGSKSTFTLGRFGGQGGRALLAGDTLYPGAGAPQAPCPIPDALRPVLQQEWEIGVLDGPHGAPEFFTPAGIAAFYAASWTVHYNSSRTGVRLIGPKPLWARKDGGEAGLHPSNIHDTAYAIGAVDFTGDMPVILGPDGPSLGGFVCPVTIPSAELWKTGQLRAGDTVRFHRLSPSDAEGLRFAQQEGVRALHMGPPRRRQGGVSPLLLGGAPATDRTPGVTYRRAGDCNILVEYGEQSLDLELRFRVHALMNAIEALRLPGIIDLTPGIRSLQVHHDPDTLPLSRLLDSLQRAEATLAANDDLAVPSRIVHLPLSWDDPATREAIARYTKSVRPDAPWCPSNIEFIRRINGLASTDEVKRIVLSAEYLVLGLGDVYLGAPVATPVDPRHRLVTTKYNPARTWTPENAVGIGGAYLCVYGMEGPGGYQFVGRTCQVWNSHRTTREFVPGQPWLLRFFDRIRFYEVSAEALLRFREDFPHGAARLEIQEDQFRLRDYRAFLAENAADIAAFKGRQQVSFEAERTRWEAAGLALDTVADLQIEPPDDLPPARDAVTSPVAGGVWKLLVEPGDRVQIGAVLLLLESMKAEIAVSAPWSGTVRMLHCVEGQVVKLGQALIEIGRD